MATFNRLYPPTLTGSLPAFYKNYEKDKNTGEKKLLGCTINIPFGINRAVNMKSINKIALRLRTVSTNTYLATDYMSTSYDPETYVATFKFDYDAEDENTDITASLINEGQYYRVQIAFVDGETIGYYSTVGIIKCVAKPSVEIKDFTADAINQFDHEFFGIYKQNTEFGDSTEKEYTYKFELFDDLGNIILESGEQIHDVTQDTYSDSSEDIWTIEPDFPENKIYRLRYTVTTLNGLTVTSIDYRVQRCLLIESEYKEMQIHADAIVSEGYIDVYMEGPQVEELIISYEPIPVTSQFDELLVYYVYEYGEYEEFSLPENPTDAQIEAYMTEWEGLKSNNRIYIKTTSALPGEQRVNGNFVISRASSKDNYFEWTEITGFTLKTEPPSNIHYPDYSVEQGIHYKYAWQQVNIHKLRSVKKEQTDSNGNPNTTMADFEDIFLSDGERNLKICFNPKVTSFKNSIPEQKIETIGSKYPFIFRNGSVCYKEFPIGGLITFQMDTAQNFLTLKEQQDARILTYDYIRVWSNIKPNNQLDAYDATKYTWQKLKLPIYYTDHNGEKRFAGYRYVYTEYNAKQTKITYKRKVIDYEPQLTYFPDYEYDPTIDQDEQPPTMIRPDKSLTGENFYGERYFKLKVLDWLTDGKVKLFRSSTEGNYLVRLLNVNLTPQEPLGRMIHQFTCTAYEVGELTYKNLTASGITKPVEYFMYEDQWASIDLNPIFSKVFNNNTDDLIIDANGFIKISPTNCQIDSIFISDFSPGDQIRVGYNEGPDNIFTIGKTGSLELNHDDRTIVEVYVKPNKNMSIYDDFSRNFFYQTTNLKLTRFDAITGFSTHSRVANQFIGPVDNLLEPYILKNHIYDLENYPGVILHPFPRTVAFNDIYTSLKDRQYFTYQLEDDVPKITGTKIEILHVSRKEVIPIYCYTKRANIGTNKFGMTPFGIPYINGVNIHNYMDMDRGIIKYVDEVLTMDANGKYIRAEGINIEDICTILRETGTGSRTYDLLEPFFYDEETQQWLSFLDYPNAPAGYFDMYRKQWMPADEKYDPTFAINELHTFSDVAEQGYYPQMIGDNNISLLELNEITLYNLDNIAELKLGNGVVAEVTFQVNVINYEVEETDIDTRQWKEKYLEQKAAFNPLIDNAMLHAGEIFAAKEEKITLEQEIQSLDTQIKIYENGANASEGVMSIASNRLIQQKQKLWDTLQAQIIDILKLLKQQKVYLSIDGQATNLVDALKNYIINNEQAANQDFSEKVLTTINNLYLYANPAKIETINVDGTDYNYNIIDDTYLFYPQQYENIKLNAESVMTKCDEQISALQAQRGEIIGGYLEDYDEDHLPPENTLVNAQYQLQRIKQDKEDAWTHMMQLKAKYVNKLLDAALMENDVQDNLIDDTDEYISSSADKLAALFNIYISQITELAEAATSEEAQNVYQNEITKLTSQRDILLNIKDDPGTARRNIETAMLNIENNKTTNNNTKTQLDTVQTKYINATGIVVNRKLRSVQETLNNLLDPNNEISLYDKAQMLLNMLTDKYNKVSAQTVTTRLEEFYEKLKEPEASDNDLSALIARIQDINSVYQAELTKLNKEEQQYKAEETKYKTEIHEIDVTCESIKLTKTNAKAEFDEAEEVLDFAYKTKNYWESADLIERIANNKTNQDNVQLTVDYINWLEKTQNDLLDQIGQIFANLTVGKDYAQLLLKYINAYELEAFEFLHYFDALDLDLQEGYLGYDGVDWLYNNAERYWLDVYKNTLFLKDNIRGQEPITTTNDEMILALSNSDKSVRLTAYADLKNYLKNLLLDDMPETINIGILTQSDNSGKKYRLVRIIDTDEDSYYPKVYELNDTDLTHELGLQASINLVRDMVNYNMYDREFRQVLPIINDETGEETYIQDPRATEYYYGDSTFDHLVPIDQTKGFDYEAHQGYHNGNPIKWLTPYPPLSVNFTFHHNLFTDYTYEQTFQNILTNQDAFLISPTYYTFFNNVIGLIVHEQRNNDEYGSWLGLKEIDNSLWKLLSQYLIAWINFSQISTSVTGTTVMNDYNELLVRLQEANVNLEKYKGIKLECETVLETYEAQKIPDSAPEKKQLIILLQMAEDEIEYWLEQKKLYEEQLEEILNNNTEFKEYVLQDQSLRDINKDIQSLIFKYDAQYKIYRAKVNHYLQLLFNNEPYGHKIDTKIVRRSETLHVNGDDTSMYNFGLAYAIENYKENKDNESEISFTNVIEHVNNFNEILNNNLDFVFPVTANATYSRTKSYFIKENNKFTKYRYVDRAQWNNDKQNLDLYVTDYPSLIDFATDVIYRPLNRLDQYDDAQIYYKLERNEYIKTIVTLEDYEDLKDSLYIKVGNGGLKKFITNLLNGSDYIASIKEAYNGTLDLYLSLLAQSLGDTSILDNLRALYARDLLRKQEIDEILKNDNIENLNLDEKVNEIYESLTNYLMNLTIAYIEQVEGGYGLI